MGEQTTITCPKCGQDAGNDWFQCGGICPVPISPHYDPMWTKRKQLKKERDHRVSITVRMPAVLSRRMAKLAEKRGVSQNTLMLEWLRAQADKHYLELIGADQKGGAHD